MIDQAGVITEITNLIVTFGAYAIAILGAVLTAMFLYDVVLVSLKRVYRRFRGRAS